MTTLSLGTAHANEYRAARELSEALGCELREVGLSANRALELFDRVIWENEVFDGITAEVLVQLARLYDAAAFVGAWVVTGYGSDLLFDGMLRHTAYMNAVGLRSTSQLVERTRWTGELSPFVHWARGLAVEHVFWDPGVISLALRIPRRLCYVHGVEKRILRTAAVTSGLLSQRLAFREKTALSAGTGANRLLAEALGIDEPDDYEAKSRFCLARFRRIFDEEETPPNPTVAQP